MRNSNMMNYYKKSNSNSKYNSDYFKQWFGDETTGMVISPEPRTVNVYKNNEKTDEIGTFVYLVVFEGFMPFELRFTSDQNLKQFDRIEIIGAEACDWKNETKFRAKKATVINEK